MKTLIIIYAVIANGTGVSTSTFQLNGLSSVECTNLKQDFLSDLNRNGAVVLSAKCINDK